MSAQKPKTPRFRVNQLAWLKDPGAPYEDWNGCSVIIVDVEAGDRKQYVAVRPVIPFRGDDQPEVALFHPEKVCPETRPWLKKKIREFITLREDLLRVAENIAFKYGKGRI